MRLLKTMTILLCFLSLSINAQHQNVVISTSNNPNEPSICLNPKNPNQIVAASNIQNVYSSNDGGKTWDNSIISSSLGVWGDPIIAVDTAENFYFFHLSNPKNGNWIDRIVCQRRDAGTSDWNDGGFAGLNGKKNQDKHGIAIDPKTNYLHVCWTEFDSYGSNSGSDSSRILYSYSANNGNSWSTPIRINKKSGDCLDSDNTVEGAVPCIGPNGEIYVAWTGPEGIVFDRSLDGGKTWLDNDIPVSNVPGGWDYEVPGIYRCNGLPATACDRSNGPNKGTIYINWTDQRNGIDDTDVWLVKSIDGGKSWSSPIRVNDDTAGKQQFFSWMTLDQATGYIWFVYYDRRNYSDTKTDVYMAVSKNGGISFENFKVSESYFIPDSKVFFGDYTSVTAYNNVVRPIWTRLHLGNLSVITAIINTDITHSIDIKEDNESNISPNPASNEVYFSYKLRKEEKVKLLIRDMNGRVIATLKNSTLPSGKYIERILTSNYDLIPGMYFIELNTSQGLKLSKFIIQAK